MAEKLCGYSPAGIFGYSHMLGGYAGGQAEYARVPFADVGPIKVPDDLPDEQVLFLSDIFPTGYMAAENCDIQPGDIVAVWGCGPVGQFAIKSAYLLGAERVIAIDRFPVPAARWRASEAGAETHQLRGGRRLRSARGDDRRPRARRLHRRRRAWKATARARTAPYDRSRQTMMLETDRAHALRQAILACRNGGTVSVPGVYGGFIDKFPMGAIINRR